jgi:hypothetical protein
VPIDQAKPDPSAEWWTTSEVAACLGLRVAMVSSYRILGQMPEPDMTVGRTRARRPSKIIAWLRNDHALALVAARLSAATLFLLVRMMTETELDPARAGALLEKACVSVGLDPAGARLLRIGSNAVYRLAAPVVRIARSGASLGQARRSVAVARWLESVGFPAVRAVHVDQPLVVSSRL